MKHYLKFIEKTNFIFFLLFIFSATFASELFRFFGTIWFVSWILEFRFIKKENLHKDRIIAPFIFLGAWWLFQALSLIWTSNTVAGISTLNKQIYLIGFLVVTLFGVNKEYNLKTIFTTFIAGVVVSSLVYFFSIFYFTNQAQYFTDPFNKHTLLFPWQEYAEYSSFIKHRLYHCTLLITSLIFTGYMYRIWKKQVGLYYTLAIVLALTGIIMATILLTGSRAALLSIFLISVVYFIYKFRKYRLITLSIIILFMVGAILTIKLHPRMDNITRQDIESLGEDKGAIRQDSEPRLHIWAMAIEHWSEYILVGKGVGSSRNYLVNIYKEENVPQFYLERKYNAHNQYLENTIETGIIGLVLFLAAFVTLFLFATPKTRVFVSYYLILILSNLLTESMMGRTDGILSIGLTLFIFILMNREEESRLQLSEV